MLSWASAVAQSPPPHETLFYNNGELYIDSSVVVQIFGNTVTTGPLSILQNNGEIYVHFDTLYLNAKRGFTIDNSAIVRGSGYYEIEPDWTNNSQYFIPDNSRVKLMSDIQQKISGTAVTNFYQLDLTGKGIGNDRIKRMTINAVILDSLSINNHELATDTFTMLITNTEPTSLSFSNVPSDRGFVSSTKGDLQEGSLARRTANSKTPYFYPVGSSVNPPPNTPYIYRPVDILPDTSNINRFSVRFAYESPDLQGYDQFSLGDSLCSVNPDYYHIVNRQIGQDPARVRFYFDPLIDDTYDYLAQWRNGKWNLIKGTVYDGTGTMFKVFTPNHLVFSQDTLPFILADRNPAKADIFGIPDICSQDLSMLRAVGNSNFYFWSVPGNVNILSDPGNDTLIFKAGTPGKGYVHLNANSSTAKCVVAADSFLIDIHKGPDAHFSVNDLIAFTKQELRFRDSTMGEPVEWYWKFGDGNSASSPIVKHKFPNVGDYRVEMYVKDVNGCIDSTDQLISIIEGIFIPNVFTPNGDGANDFFYIPNSGMKEYHFQVFNRWGNLLFETTAPEISWDGYSNYGTPLAEGTYYYVLDAKGERKDYSAKGYLTLLR